MTAIQIVLTKAIALLKKSQSNLQKHPFKQIEPNQSTALICQFRCCLAIYKIKNYILITSKWTRSKLDQLKPSHFWKNSTKQDNSKALIQTNWTKSIDFSPKPNSLSSAIWILYIHSTKSTSLNHKLSHFKKTHSNNRSIYHQLYLKTI